MSFLYIPDISDTNFNSFTLDSRIDVGQEINVGPGNFDKKNKCSALNKHTAWIIWQKL